MGGKKDTDKALMAKPEGKTTLKTRRVYSVGVN